MDYAHRFQRDKFNRTVTALLDSERTMYILLDPTIHSGVRYAAESYYEESRLAKGCLDKAIAILSIDKNHKYWIKGVEHARALCLPYTENRPFDRPVDDGLPTYTIDKVKFYERLQEFEQTKEPTIMVLRKGASMDQNFGHSRADWYKNDSSGITLYANSDAALLISPNARPVWVKGVDFAAKLGLPYAVKNKPPEVDHITEKTLRHIMAGEAGPDKIMKKLPPLDLASVSARDILTRKTELWWQRKDREERELREEIVALRNDIRKWTNFSED